MQADRNDRFDADKPGNRHSTQTLVTAIAVLILGAGAYLLMPGGDDTPLEEDLTPTPGNDPVVAAPREPEPDAAILAAPDIPEAPALEPEPRADEPEQKVVVAAPPSPEEIDLQLRSDIRATGLTPDSALASAFNAPYLLDRGVSSLDQLARGLVPTRTSNLARPKGAFATTQEGADYSMSRAGYRRYDALVSAVTALPIETLAQLFKGQRGLLQDAYAALGYPADALDNTLIAALDVVLSAPIREEPPALVSKGALWAYADPALEGASDLHKQLLRTGPENTEALQQWAQNLRNTLLER